MNDSNTLLGDRDIDRILTRMTHEILEVHEGAANFVLVGIVTRGVYLARRLSEKIQAIEGVNVPTGEMDINLYRDDWTRIHHQPEVRATEIAFPIERAQIILVDDVLYTGRTIRAAMDALMDFGRPDRIELAVLVDRGHRELPIQGNYVGKFLETRRTETVNVLLSESDGNDQVVVDNI